VESSRSCRVYADVADNRSTRSEDKVNLYSHVYTPCIHGEEAVLETED
jgi:hypothetical protein